MNNNCARCAVLWREYAASTHAHFAIESKLQVCGFSHDHEAVKRLLPESQAAAERRTELRRQIHEHEEALHCSENVDEKTADSGITPTQTPKRLNS